MKRYFQFARPVAQSVFGAILIFSTTLISRVSAGGFNFEIKNPTPSYTSIEQVIEAILGVVVVIATPIVVFFIIYAGFLYVTARGNAQQVEQATRQLTYAIIGAILILGAVALSGIIKQLISAFQ